MRVTRTTGDMQKAFRNRYASDGQPGASFTLMLTLKNQYILPLGRDAVSIDTFIDDTYQTLLNTNGNGNTGFYQQPAVSDDGSMMLFTVQSNKPPADDAERVFVRGSVLAKLAHGEAKKVTAPLQLKVGGQVAAGPFKGTVRNLSDMNQNAISAGINLTTDSGALRSVRVLGKTGTVLQEKVDLRDRVGDGTGTYLNLNFPAGNDEVTLEFTYFENVDTLRIPFEAQADIGATKAGPAQKVAEAPKPRADRHRPWPPPTEQDRVDFADRRTTLSPTSQPAPEKMATATPTVDLFSLTLGKPSPEQTPGESWQNKPSPTLRPWGYTIARLLLSVPNGSILSVAPDGLALTRFGDDKTERLDAELMPAITFPRSIRRNNIAQVSRDGQQALINVPIDSSPTPGATRATLEGTVKAEVGYSPKTAAADDFGFGRSQRSTVGPFTVRVVSVYQPAAVTPQFPNDEGFTVALEISGPVKRLQSVDFPGLIQRYRMPPDLSYSPDSANGDSVTMSVQFTDPPPDKQHIELHYFDTIETVQLPFKVTTGIGL